MPSRLLPQLASVLIVGLAMPATPASAELPAGWHRLTLPPPAASYAMVYVPDSLPPGAAAAVVFLHGAGSSPEGWQATLAPLAEELGLVVIAPRAGSNAGWGVGPDDAIVGEALRQTRAAVALDPARLGLAGHSAGGAYAIELAYSTRWPFVAVFALSAPYRTVVELADPVAPPPLRFYYGTDDPNYAGGAYGLLRQMLLRLGVVVSADLQAGYGHNSWPTASLVEGFRFLVEQPRPACLPEPHALCLREGRFRVEATWETATGTGAAQGRELSDESGSFWFFSPANLELDVKVLDGCAVNGHYWVFAAGLTDVGVTLTVTDTATSSNAVYRHPRGAPYAPVQDTAAFESCP
jgi:pimeloyl-ACP methyl ester carboxylesterase